MMNFSKIEWCDFTWNPITGCRHTCSYCYARRQSKRLAGDPRINKNSPQIEVDAAHMLYTLEKPFHNVNNRVIPSPAGFEPTLHKYRLNDPIIKKKPANIFVCSMADLFGTWVPDEWINEVLSICTKATQHRFMFLTKNPEKYTELKKHCNVNASWYFGITVTDIQSAERAQLVIDDIYADLMTFLSIEPIREDISGHIDFEGLKWVIIGAETQNGKVVFAPEQAWIENVVNQCRAADVPVFLKNSLADVWENELIQEYPW